MTALKAMNGDLLDLSPGFYAPTAFIGSFVLAFRIMGSATPRHDIPMISVFQRLLTKFRFRAAVIWLMAPLALWSGLPFSACICADGHYELFCAAHSRQASASAACCSCCPTAKSCCKHSTCCASSEGGADRCASNGNSCCTQVGRVTFVPPASAAAPIMDCHALAIILPVADVTAHMTVRTLASRIFALDTGPPLDLVVTLQRFVI